MLDVWKNPKAAPENRDQRNQENYTPTEIQEVIEDLGFPFSLTWMSHWDYKGLNQFATRSPSSYFPLPSEQSLKASVVVLPGEKGKETACMILIILLNRVSWENDLLVVFSYLEIYLKNFFKRSREIEIDVFNNKGEGKGPFVK